MSEESRSPEPHTINLVDVTLPSPVEFVLTRRFHAPRALVYQAWTDPKHLARWWGPHTFHNPTCEVDLRVGGSYRMSMRSAQGQDHPVCGTFLEIVPNERLVISQNTDDHPVEWHELLRNERAKAGGVTQDGPQRQGVIVTVTFSEDAGITTLRIRLVFPDHFDRDVDLNLGAPVGWSQSLERLEALLPLPPMDKARALHITRVFQAPRDLVFRAHTELQHLSQWWMPKGFTQLSASVDAQPGGIFHYGLRAPDGLEFWGKKVYCEVSAPHRLVYINSFADADANLAHHPWNAAWPLQTLTILTFEEHEGRTILELWAFPAYGTEAECEQFFAGKLSMHVGFGGTFDNLDALLARL